MMLAAGIVLKLEGVGRVRRGGGQVKTSVPLRKVEEAGVG